jgi:sugar phosphate isomerase/epimerase
LVESTSDELWLWAGTLAHAGLAERADAALAGGFACVSLFPRDYRVARTAGLADADILALHAERGVRLTTLDPFARWLPRWEPPAGASPERIGLIGAEQAEFFAIAEALELETMSAIEPFGTRYPIEQLAEHFAALCDRAAASGLRVHLEFSPFSGIPDVATALDVVRLAGRPNGGIVFDTWHYLRGRRDDELLARAPGELIFAVQVNDAAAEPVGPLVEDTWKRRRLPGEGDFDLATVLGILEDKQRIGPFGIEVLSEELWALEPVEIGRRAGAALRAALS